MDLRVPETGGNPSDMIVCRTGRYLTRYISGGAGRVLDARLVFYQLTGWRTSPSHRGMSTLIFAGKPLLDWIEMTQTNSLLPNEHRPVFADGASCSCSTASTNISSPPIERANPCQRATILQPNSDSSSQTCPRSPPHPSLRPRQLPLSSCPPSINLGHLPSSPMSPHIQPTKTPTLPPPTGTHPSAPCRPCVVFFSQRWATPW